MSVRDRSAPDCSICGADEEGIHWIEVQVDGEVISADLCDECFRKTRSEDKGEEVDWDV